MPWKILFCLIVAMVLQPVTAVAAGSRVPLAVSPGEIGEVSLVDDRCPTFSWGAVEGAAGYELVVYRVSVDGEDAERVLHQRISGAALSWTPSLDRCLERAGRYAWAVRAVGGRVESPWSEERLFRVESGLEQADAAVALAILRRFLDEGGSLEELTATEPRPAPQLGSQPAGGGSSSEAPAAIPIPPPDPVRRHVVGLTSEVETETSEDRSAIAVRGRWEASDGPERARGYLGVAVGNTDSFDGYPHLRGLRGQTMGVLGVAIPGFGDYAVVGVGTANTTGGYFFNADSSGITKNRVKLGSASAALTVSGRSIFNGEVSLSTALKLKTRIVESQSSGNSGPESYRIIDSKPDCDGYEHGRIMIMRPSAAGKQDALCFCGLVDGSYDWWCFNP